MIIILSAFDARDYGFNARQDNWPRIVPAEAEAFSKEWLMGWDLANNCEVSSALRY